MILLDGLYINNGGGRVLLEYLIVELEKKNQKVYYLLDERMSNYPPMVKASNSMIFMKSSLINRFCFYYRNRNKFKKILCFGNIPPFVKCNAQVYTYFHQKLFVEIPNKISFPRKIELFIKSKIFALMIKNTDNIIVQSRVMKEALVAKVPKLTEAKVLIIPFFSILESDKNQEKRGKNTFLYVSSGIDYKNHNNLLQAFCEFFDNNQCGELHLTVGNENEVLVNKIKELEHNYPIFNHGFVDKIVLNSLYNKATFLIFPSLIESFGLGLIEGIISGCSIIGADLPYTYAVCQPSLVFDPLNVSSIRLAIEESQTKNISKSVLIVENQIDDLILLLLQ